MKVKAVQIAIPNYRQTVISTLAGWLFSVVPPEGWSYLLDFVYKQPVDACRNAIVKRFLEDNPAEWLFMIDDDIAPWPTVLEMVEHKKKIISALCYIHKAGVPVSTCVLKRKKDWVKFGGAGEGSNEPLEVQGVGTGALLIHRSVLEKIKPPWFRFTYKTDGTVLQGEDFYFSQKAKKAGYSLWLDSSRPCGHIHPIDIREEAALIQVALSCEDAQEFEEQVGLWTPKTRLQDLRSRD